MVWLAATYTSAVAPGAVFRPYPIVPSTACIRDGPCRGDPDLHRRTITGGGLWDADPLWAGYPAYPNDAMPPNWCPGVESNHVRQPFQGCALPVSYTRLILFDRLSDLSHHLTGRCRLDVNP